MPRPNLRPEDKLLAQCLGEAIRSIRKTKGIKAEDFAFSVGVSAQTVSAWELGKALPYFQHLVKMGEALGVRVSRIIAIAERLVWVQKARMENTNGR